MLAIGGLGAEDFTGFGTGGYCRIHGEMRGVTIGILNWVDELHGLQLGLINIAGNNPGIFKVLPLINYHK